MAGTGKSPHPCRNNGRSKNGWQKEGRGFTLKTSFKKSVPKRDVFGTGYCCRPASNVINIDNLGLV